MATTLRQKGGCENRGRALVEKVNSLLDTMPDEEVGDSGSLLGVRV